MSFSNLPQLRLAAQGLASPGGSPADALARLLAVQGQDYPGGKWALGLRSAGCTDADVEQAIIRREIVRTWALRGTLQFVPAADLRWLVALVGPVIINGNARRFRELELDEITLRRSADILAGALAGGKPLDRPALFEILEEKGISTQGQRGVYMLQHASLLNLICQGVTVRNRPTFYLIDEALPKSAPKSEDEALAELARRYFTTRGPATLLDFVWWTGLPVAKARKALDLVRSQLVEEELEGTAAWRSPGAAPDLPPAPYALLLPGFDEYLLSYKDRTAILDPATIQLLTHKNGMPPATVAVDGMVIGVWKRTLIKDNVSIIISPVRDLSTGERGAVERAAARFGEFLGKKPIVNFS